MIERPPLKGPAIPARQRLITEAMQHVFHDQWWDALFKFEELLATGAPPREILSGYATCLMNVGRAREAAEAYERCIPLRPEKLSLRENVIFCRDQCDDTTAAEAYARRREFWDLHMRDVAEQHARPHANTRDPERALRIGYVSGDFRSHSANMSFGAVVMRHTPEVDVYCYSTIHPSHWDHFTTLYSQEKILRV